MAPVVHIPGGLTPSGVLRVRGDLEEAVQPGLPVVLRGGDPFCTGLELADATRLDSAAGLEAALEGFVGLLLQLRCGRVPTVAVVEGGCFGGGLGIAAACDVVIATPGARFGLPEALFGMVPALVRPVVTERIGPQATRLLALRGMSIDVHQAASIGLVDRVVDPETLDRTVRAEVRALGRATSASVAWLKASPGLPDALAGAARVTLERLLDPAVARAVRTYTAGGLPWETA